MNQFIPLWLGIVSLALGSVLGYFARQSIARKEAGSIEEKLQKKISRAKSESEEILSKADKKALEVVTKAREEENQKRLEISNTQHFLLKREDLLNRRLSELETKEEDFRQKVEKLKKIKITLENLKEEASKNLEKISGLTKNQAKKN